MGKWKKREKNEKCENEERKKRKKSVGEFYPNDVVCHESMTLVDFQFVIRTNNTKCEMEKKGKSERNGKYSFSRQTVHALANQFAFSCGVKNLNCRFSLYNKLPFLWIKVALNVAQRVLHNYTKFITRSCSRKNSWNLQRFLPP